MPRLKNRVPSYRLHKATGQAIVTLNGQDNYLGPYDSPESRNRYDTLIAEWLANNRQSDTNSLTINELFVAYWQYVESYYVKNGKPTGEQKAIKYALIPAVELYGHTQVDDFGPRALKTVQEDMMGRGWVRTLINSRIKRIRRMFKWGVENELVKPAILHGLQAVSPLRRGRHAVRESEPVKPVPTERVNAVLPFVTRQVRAMIQLQLLTGMRSGEVALMRRCDIDTSGDVWTYRPESHKTEHHGHERVVYLGPQAQKVITPFFKPEMNAYLFSPIDADRERREKLHRNRKTPMSCGNRPGTKRKNNPKRKPKGCYTPETYCRAIARACDKAFPAPTPLCKQDDETIAAWKARLSKKQHEELVAWQRAHRWHPHQLRHNAATNLRSQYGVEVARVILGHHSIAVTELYAERDQAKAITVMAQRG